MLNVTVAGHVHRRSRCALVLALALIFMLGGQVSAKEKIVFWTDSNPVTAQLVAEFNRRSERVEVQLQVEPVTGSLSQIADKVSVAIAGGRPPDVMRFNRPYASEWAAKGLLVPLDPYLKTFGVAREQFIPFAWSEGTYEGRVYVLPEETDARAVYFNRHLLVQGGIDTENFPTSLAEFDAVAAKLTRYNADGSYAQVGFIPWSNQGRYLFTWTPSFGGRLYDPGADKITVNDPHNVRVLEWMKGYADRYGYGAARGSLPAGTLALVVDTNGYSRTLDKTAGLEYGVAYLPAPADGRQKATYAGGFGIAIPTGAAHPREAAEFIAFWVSDEAQLTRAKAKGNFPATLRAARDPFFVNDPIQRVFIDMLPNAQARPNVPILGQLWDAIKETTNRVLQENESPAAVLDDVTRRGQQMLNEARRR